MENELELRMYFFTISSLKGILQGIMCGHAALRYARLYSAKHPEVWDFVDNHKTWIILNGGTTNDQRDFENIPLGTLNQISDQLQENDIKFSYFIEPDLNNALTSVCFLVDERVFNKKDYPDFVDYILDMKIYHNVEEVIPPEKYVMLKTMSIEKLQEMFPNYYDKWIYFLGGIKNVFLRELLNDKDLA